MPKLHFYYSAMNAGKSTALLQSSYNYQEKGMNTLLLAPLIDDRYGQSTIGSRIGLAAKAVNFAPDTNLYELIQKNLSQAKKIHCVLIDEAQFLKNRKFGN